MKRASRYMPGRNWRSFHHLEAIGSGNMLESKFDFLLAKKQFKNLWPVKIWFCFGNISLTRPLSIKYVGLALVSVFLMKVRLKYYSFTNSH